MECLPHSEQPSALRLLCNSTAAFPAQSRAHSQCTHLHSHQPARCNEGPEGKAGFKKKINKIIFILQISGFLDSWIIFKQEGQVELKELTAASLDKLLEGHSVLQAQQGELHEGQEQMTSSLRDNLERLGQEKALIASGQELVAQLIQGITQRMGENFTFFCIFILFC